MGALNRRQFLTSAVVGGAAVAATSMIGCAPAKPDEPSELSTTSSPNNDASILDKPWSFEIAPEPIADDTITQTIEADVIVVGAGTSGLCTAISAAEEGAHVALFAMGAGPIGRGGSNFAFHSSYRESLGLAPVDPYPYLQRHILGCAYDIDQAKWYKWCRNSEETMNWMIDIMAETGEYALNLEQVTHDACDDPAANEYQPIATHGWTGGSKPDLGVGDGQPVVVERLAQKAAELGVELHWNLRARQLVRGGTPNGTEGRVTAVIAEGDDGSLVKFEGSKAVVLATGDFSRNRDMVAKYAPQAYNWITNFDAGDDFDPEDGKVYGGLYEGDGQQMGLWIGAAWQKSYPNAAMAGTRFPGADDIGILLNSEGKRFMAETLAGTWATNAYQHLTGTTMYQIWDSAYAETGAPWPKRKTGYGAPLSTPEEMIGGWNEKVEKGEYVKADTLEEVIEQLGLPAETLAEVQRYNDFAHTGVDEDFYKWKGFLRPIEQGPFYGCAAEPLPTFLCLMGGLRTDANMRVCDSSDAPIPGLYNVGTMVGDAYASTYSLRLPGQNLGMNCICFGYLTGKFIMENE